MKIKGVVTMGELNKQDLINIAEILSIYAFKRSEQGHDVKKLQDLINNVEQAIINAK
jgi:hypothetical protein